MKKLLAPLLLLALAFGTLQLPALADFSMTFGRHARHHSDRWTYGDFQNANRYYYRNHRDEVVVSPRELRRHFDRLDVNRHGYLTIQEAQAYRTWE